MAYGQKILKGDAYKRAAIKRRHIRIRKNINGTAERPRLVVTRSNRHIVAQVIDDLLALTELDGEDLLVPSIEDGMVGPQDLGLDERLLRVDADR